MTLTRHTETNRNEARRGGGPRTQAGKARARMNALRHGLASCSPDGEQAAKERDRVARLARIIAGDSSEAAVLDCAAALAESTVDLASARAAEVRLIERWHEAAAPPPAAAAQAPDICAQDIVATREIILTSIAGLGRYGRHARARRRRALRAYAILGCVRRFGL